MHLALTVVRTWRNVVKLLKGGLRLVGGEPGQCPVEHRGVQGDELETCLLGQ